ncbi:uncharacterized, partial [Tachysurus ichikawai]
GGNTHHEEESAGGEGREGVKVKGHRVSLPEEEPVPVEAAAVKSPTASVLPPADGEYTPNRSRRNPAEPKRQPLSPYAVAVETTGQSTDQSELQFLSVPLDGSVSDKRL